MFLNNPDKVEKFFQDLTASRFSYSFLFLYTLLYFVVLFIIFRYWQYVNAVVTLQLELHKLKFALDQSNLNMISLVENLEKYEDSMDMLNENVSKEDKYGLVSGLKLMFHLSAFATAIILALKHSQ